MSLKKCIYCLCVEDSDEDWNGEHLFPAQLGCPDSYQFYREVCPKCNQDTSSLETTFKENTPEGHLSAMYQLGRGEGYRSMGRRMQVTTKATGLEISPEVMFRVDLKTRKLSIPAQTTYVHNSRRVTVFRPLSPRKLKEKLKFLASKDFEAVSFNRLGEKPFHSEITAESIKSDTPKIIPRGEFGPVEFHYAYQMDRDIARVLAKIAFNYFARCALPSFDTIVFDHRFEAIRRFVRMSDAEYDQLVGLKYTLLSKIEQKPIFFEGAEIPAGHPIHSFSLKREIVPAVASKGERGGFYKSITCTINLFSLHEYKINLGFDPFNTLNLGTFGCAHVFDIETKEWIRIDNAGKRNPPNDFTLIR